MTDEVLEQLIALDDQRRAARAQRAVAPQPTTAAPPEQGDVMRGFHVGWDQAVPSLKGAVGLVGATAEDALGEGGISTAVKNWGLNGFKEGMAKLQPMQHENDDVTVAWENAKKGNPGALADWAQYAFGYGVAQMAQTAAVGFASGVVGGALTGGAGAAPAALAGAVEQTAAKGIIRGMVEKAIAKRTAAIAAEKGLVGTPGMSAARQAAVKSLASDIGSVTGLTLYNTAQEAGQIYPAAEDQAAQSGAQLTGSDLARVWGATIVAGASETVPDVIGLGALAGKFKGLTDQLGKTRLRRGLTGAVAGGALEGGQEAFQTAVEHYGAGQPIADDAGLRDIVNSAAMGALPGVVAGGGVGAASRHSGAVPAGDDLDQTLARAGDIRKTIEALPAPGPFIAGREGIGRQTDVLDETQRRLDAGLTPDVVRAAGNYPKPDLRQPLALPAPGQTAPIPMPAVPAAARPSEEDIALGLTPDVRRAQAAATQLPVTPITTAPAAPGGALPVLERLNEGNFVLRAPADQLAALGLKGVYSKQHGGLIVPRNKAPDVQAILNEAAKPKAPEPVAATPAAPTAPAQPAAATARPGWTSTIPEEAAVPEPEAPPYETIPFEKVKNKERYRGALQAMASEAGWFEIGGKIKRNGEGASAEEAQYRPHQVGEVVGRTTWVPNAPWFADAQKEAPLPKNTGGAATQKAVDKALAGEKLTAAEQRHVQWMTDYVHADIEGQRETVARPYEELDRLRAGNHMTDSDLEALLSRDPEELYAESPDVEREAMDLTEKARAVNPDAVEALRDSLEPEQAIVELRKIIAGGSNGRIAAAQAEPHAEGVRLPESVEPTARASAEAPAQEVALQPASQPETVSHQPVGELLAQIEQRAHEAATSPKNELPEPTGPQKEAGNYTKGHVRLHGLDISIENPKGSKRRPHWPVLKSHYGYIRGTMGKDKDHLDVFVGPHPEAQTAYVVDQLKADGKTFDEHKVLLGFDSEEDARNGYLENYTPGWKGLGAITAIPIEKFKEWANGENTTKPVAYNALARAKEKGRRSVVKEPARAAAAPEPERVEEKPAAEVPRSEPDHRAGPLTDDEMVQNEADAEEAALDREPAAPAIGKNKVVSVREALLAGNPNHVADWLNDGKVEPVAVKNVLDAVVDTVDHPGRLVGLPRRVADLLVDQDDASVRELRERVMANGDKIKKNAKPIDVAAWQAHEARVKALRDWSTATQDKLHAREKELTLAALAKKGIKIGDTVRSPPGEIYDSRTGGPLQGKAQGELRESGNLLEVNIGGGVTFVDQDDVSHVEKVATKNRATKSASAPDTSPAAYRTKAAELTGNEQHYSADIAKELFPEYSKDKTSRRAESDRLQEEAGRIRDRAFSEALAEPPTDATRTVTLMAGGTGSGKTTLAPDTGIVYDTTLASFEGAKKWIDEALESGRKVDVHYVYREPVEAYRDGVVGRADRIGRSVPSTVHVNTHRGASETVRQLLDHYHGDARVDFEFIDNTARGARTVDAAPEYDYNGLNEKLAAADEAGAPGRESGGPQADTGPGAATQGVPGKPPAQEAEELLTQTPPSGGVSASGGQQADLLSTVATSLRTAADAIEKAAKPAETFEDFGDKIGGARKDTAAATGPRTERTEEGGEEPAWRKRFIPMQSTSTGKWTLMDKRTERMMRDGWRTLEYDTEAEAEAAIPLAAVALKHRVVHIGTKDAPAFEIWRDVTDRKRVKVVDQAFGSREDALRYMAAHAAEIIETKTAFGEEILAKPERPMRTGKERRQGPATAKMFGDTFGFRGVEFGNWNNQAERQEVMNHAYDGLLDMAEIVGIPPKAVSLNGELALAFGARGQGLIGAKAHYERNYGVINLTKMSGAGSLAHEWFHALDHNFARQDGKAHSEMVRNEDGHLVYKAESPLRDYLSHGRSAQGSKVRPEVWLAYERLMQTMFRKAEQYVEDTVRAEKFVGETRRSLQDELAGLRGGLAKTLEYKSRGNKPASAEQLAAFDALATRIVEGGELTTSRRENKNARARSVAAIIGYQSNDALDGISAILKQVRGTTGFSTERTGWLDRVRNQMGLLDQRIKMLESAQRADTKTKMVSTSYAMEAKKIDQGRASDYWTTPHEMAARAFSAYIEDKAAEQGNASQFLSYGSDNKFYRLQGIRPFAEGAERKAIDAEFDKLFAALKAVPTDKGVALQSRAPNESRSEEQLVGMPTSRLQALADDITARLPGAPRVMVYESPSQLPPAEAAGLDDKSEGVYVNGRVILFSNAIHSEARAAWVTLHELKHAGLAAAYGRQLDAALREVERNAFVSDLADKIAQDRSGISRENALNEAMAELGAALDTGNFDEIKSRYGLSVPEAFRSGIRGAIGRFIDSLTRLLNRLLGREAVTSDDVRQMLDRARSALTESAQDVGDDEEELAPAGGLQSRTPNRASWDAPEPSRLDNVLYTLQDKHIDTRRVVEAIEKAKGRVSDSDNVRLAEELFHGRAAKRVDDFLTDELKPLLQEMKAKGITMAQLEEYLWNRHAPERNATIAERNPDMPDGGSGITTADAQAYMAKLPAPKRAALAVLAARVDAMTKRTMDTLTGYGLESEDWKAAREAQWQHYVPLFREEMDQQGGLGTGQGFSVRGPSSKSATGSQRKVVDIVANVAMARERAVTRGEKNIVANALINLAQNNPNGDFWKVDEPPTVTFLNKHTGQVETIVDPRFKSRDNVVLARAVAPNGHVVERAVVFDPHDARAMRMAHALKNLDTDDMGKLLSLSAEATRYFSAISTQYNPVFGIINLLRDYQGALFNLSSTRLAGKQREVSGEVLSALRGIYIDSREVRAGRHPKSSWAQLWEEFQNVGGQTGYRDMFRTSAERAKAIERGLRELSQGRAVTAGKAVFDWLSDYNLAMENAVRLAAYKVGKAQGMSEPQAASLAKNLTVNFNRKGQIATQAGSLYAFFNANVQGTARLAETLLGPAGRKIVTGGLMLGVMQAIALAAAGYDDDQPPQFVRERSLIIPIDGKNYLTIPMPMGLHVLPSIGRLATELVLDGFRDPGKKIALMTGMLADAFNPIGSAGLSMQTITPTVLDPLAALAENKDWTGRTIAREDYDKLLPQPGHKRAKDTATAVARWASEGINALTGGSDYRPGAFSPTPDQIDYLVGALAGGLGRELSKAEQTFQSLNTGEEMPTYKIPVVGRFYGTIDGQAGQSEAFYQNLRQVNEARAEIVGRRQNGEALGDYLKEHPEARLYRMGSTVERRLVKLRERRRDLLERDAAPDQVRAVESAIGAQMAMFNARVNELQKQIE